MHLPLLLAILSLAVSNALSVPQSRIIGGEETDISKHPYLVSIRYRAEPGSPYVHKCAGSIYTKRAIITAAQCIADIKDDERLIIVAGTNSRKGFDGFVYRVSKWIVHPAYNSWIVDYDIGLLILEQELDMDHGGLQALPIAESRPRDGKYATVAGWGYREEFGPSSHALEEVQVPILGDEQCKQAYGAGEVTERMICAGYLYTGGKDACQGDTGGPLVYDRLLVGVVSWGKGCARPGYPSVYTYVPSLRQWIDDSVAGNAA